MTNYKHQYEQMKLMVDKYQNEIVPGLRKLIAEREPVRHGRWIERLDGDGEFVHHMCSECKADAFFQYIIEADWDENIDGEWYNRGDEITGIEEFLTDYCHHCGARMDGDDDATN
jgi:hypothetical protein